MAVIISGDEGREFHNICWEYWPCESGGGDVTCRYHWHGHLPAAGWALAFRWVTVHDYACQVIVSIVFIAFVWQSANVCYRFVCNAGPSLNLRIKRSECALNVKWMWLEVTAVEIWRNQTDFQFELDTSKSELASSISEGCLISSSIEVAWSALSSCKIPNNPPEETMRFKTTVTTSCITFLVYFFLYDYLRLVIQILQLWLTCTLHSHGPSRKLKALSSHFRRKWVHVLPQSSTCKNHSRTESIL